MSDTPLRAEFDFFLKNQEKLVAEYRGKFLAIKNGKILGAFATDVEAVTETAKNEPIGTFLVQKVEPGTAIYTQTYHSRVVFA